MPHLFSAPKSGGNRCVCMSNTGVVATTRFTCARTSSTRRSGSLTIVSVADKRLSFVMRIGPAVVWHERRPSGARGILIVSVISELPVELGVLGELVAVERDPEAGAVRHAN